MIEHELEPWIVLIDHAEATQPALWRVSHSEAASLALFSTAARAEAYAAGTSKNNSRVVQPTRVSLIGLFVQCYKQGVRIAVLDPDGEGAKRAFDLREVLKAARIDLKTQM